MLSTCPKCQGRMNLPDNVAGKQVRCPHCREVFSAQEFATAPSPISSEPVGAVLLEEAGPALPPPGQKAQPAPTDPIYVLDDGPRPRDEFAFDGVDEPLMRTSAHGGVLLIVGAILLIVAPIIDIIVGILALSATGLAALVPPGYMAGMIMGVFLRMLLFGVLPGAFMILAAVFLKRRRLKGLVIAGGVLAIALPTLLAILTIVSVAREMAAQNAMMRGPALPAWAYFPAILYLLAALIAICAGVQALMTLSNPSVQRAFAANAWPEPRWGDPGHRDRRGERDRWDVRDRRDDRDRWDERDRRDVRDRRDDRDWR